MRAILMIIILFISHVGHAQTCASVFAPPLPGQSLAVDHPEALKAYHETIQVIMRMHDPDFQSFDQLRALTFEFGRKMGMSRHDVETSLAEMVRDGSIGGEAHIVRMIQGLNIKDARGKIGLRERAMYATKAELKKYYAPAFDLPNELDSRARSIATSLRQSHYQANHNHLWASDWRNEALILLWIKASMKPMMQAAIDAAPVATEGALSKVTSGKQNRAIMNRAGKEVADQVLEPLSGERSSLPAPKLTPLNLDKPDELLSFNLIGERSYQEARLEDETGKTQESLLRIQSTVTPIIRLAVETSEVQLQRLDQIEAKAREIENPREAANTETAAKKIRALVMHAAKDMNETLSSLRLQVTILESAIADSAAFPDRRAELQHWLDYAKEKEHSFIERTKEKFRAIDDHTFAKNKELLPSDEPKLNVPAVIESVTPQMSNLEIAKMLKEVPERELKDYGRLREYSVELGSKLGLTRAEVDETVETFAKDGLIGGQSHILALYDGVESADPRVQAHDFDLKGYYITRGELKRSFKETVRKPNGIEEKAQVMARRIARRHNVRDERKVAVLELWMRATMRPMMKAAIDAAPTTFQKVLSHVPRVVDQYGYKVTLGGTIALVSNMHPGLLGGAEIIAGGLGAFVGGLKFRNTKAAHWLNTRYQYDREHVQLAGQELKRLVAPDTQKLLPSEVLPEFSVDEEPVALSTQLMAEVAKQDLDGDNAYQIFNGTSAVSLAHIEDIAVPMIRLSLDTHDLQSARFAQLEAKVNEFNQKFGSSQRDQLSSQNASKVEDDASLLRTRLDSLKRDISYTVYALGEQRKELATAVRLAAKFPSRLEHLQYFLTYAEAAEKRTNERVATEIRAIDAHRKELAKHVAFPLE